MKREFKATEGLLNDVMRKQAGSIEKAVAEAVMNSVDAGAHHIEIDLEANSLIIEDDGKGMPKSEVEEYFEKFGLKDDDIEEKEFGQFRMGRGQIFSFGQNIWHSQTNRMVVDLDHDESTILHEGEEVTVDSSGLSYNLLEAEEHFDGCYIEVNLYNEVQNVDDKLNEIRNLVKYVPFLHDVEVTINGDVLEAEPENPVEGQLAVYTFETDRFSSRTRVYNKGVYVKEERLSPAGGSIITFDQLGVNFARNDILETDTLWPQVKKEYEQFALDYLLQQDELSKSEKKWLLELSSDNEEVFQRLMNKPLVPDVKGEDWSMEQLSGESISFGDPSNKVAQEAFERSSYIVLDSQFAGAIRSAISNASFAELTEVVDKNVSYEMEEVPINELNTRQRQNLARLRWALYELGVHLDVKAGFSRQKDVWKTEEEELFLDKRFLSGKKAEIAHDNLIRAVEVASMEGDTRNGEEHSYSFNRTFSNYMREAGPVQRELLSSGKDWLKEEPYKYD